jgi:hypothetical protein
MTKFLFVILASCFLISNGWAQKSQSKPNPPKAATAVETKKVNIEKYAFKVSLKNNKYTSGVAYLCFHMGKNLNIEDSAMVNENGVAVFKGNRNLPGGIYAIVFPGKNRTVDFFVNKEPILLQLEVFLTKTETQQDQTLTVC